MPGYDFIGDVHGQYGTLSALLEKLEYRKTEGVYRHPERIAVFVGDLVDRGPETRETLQLVRKMCESGSARAVMGNHEFNLICYLTRDPGGTWLREHTEKNTQQVRATLDSFKGHEGELEEYKHWMLSLPLYLDLRKIRVVHACWDHESVSRFWCSGGLFTPETLRQAALERQSPIGRAAEVLLKGRELQLPEGLSFIDAQGFLRTQKRLRWWEDPRDKRIEELLVLPLYNPAGNQKLLEQEATFPAGYPPYYSVEEELVVFGHYWLQGTPQVIRDNILCVDYGAGAGESLAAYRWSGEECFTNDHWVSLPVLG